MHFAKQAQKKEMQVIHAFCETSAEERDAIAANVKLTIWGPNWKPWRGCETFLFPGQVLNKSQDQWYQIDDLHIQEILPQVVSISEAYVQVE